MAILFLGITWYRMPLNLRSISMALTLVSRLKEKCEKHSLLLSLTKFTLAQIEVLSGENWLICAGLVCFVEAGGKVINGPTGNHKLDPSQYFHLIFIDFFFFFLSFMFEGLRKQYIHETTSPFINKTICLLEKYLNIILDFV